MAGGGRSTEELNLVPYLDIVTTLMIALVAIAAYANVDLRRAEVVAAHRRDEGTTEVPGASTAPRPEPLTIGLEPGGFVLQAPDGGVARLNADEHGLPYPLLRTVLRRLHDQPDGPTQAVLAADRTIPYRTVVATLDAIRADEAGPMYPGVALLLDETTTAQATVPAGVMTAPR